MITEKRRAYLKKWREDNKEKIQEYREANKEKAKIQMRAWMEKNKEEQKTYRKAYNEEHKEEQKGWIKSWQAANPDQMRAQRATTKAKRIKRNPPWLTKEHKKQILEFYKKARALTESTGISYEVDHIVPLQGEIVSGLHVPWNLQVITAEENLEKRNYFSIS